MLLLRLPLLLLMLLEDAVVVDDDEEEEFIDDGFFTEWRLPPSPSTDAAMVYG